MPIDLDELMPRRMPPTVRDLKPMSIGELQTYITELEAEIARARGEIQSKESVRGAAEAFFKR